MWIKSRRDVIINTAHIESISVELRGVHSPYPKGFEFVYFIICETSSKVISLASYETKERALQVLGEIGKFLNGDKPIIGTKYIDGNPYDIVGEVYNLPEE